MRKLPLFESTKLNDVLTTVTYLGKEYPAVKIDIKNKVKDDSKLIHATFGTKAMYDQMVDENDKLKGEEAVKLNGVLSGYLNITDKSTVSDIMKEVEACIGDWAEIVTKIDENKKEDVAIVDKDKTMTIVGEFGISLDDLIKVFKGSDENAAEIEQGIKAGRYDKFVAKEIGHKNLVQGIKYAEMDSYNMSHGTAYFEVTLKGTESQLKKVAGPDLGIFYDWEEMNEAKNKRTIRAESLDEGLFDRLRAKGAGAVAGAKAAVNNKVQGVVNKVKAVGQAVTGIKKGDLSQAQSTLQSAPKKVDPKQVAAKTKALSIINSMYNDLSALFPGKDVVNPLKTLYTTLTESKEVDETLVEETWDRMYKLAAEYGDGDTGWDELLDDFCRKLSDDKINEALDAIIQDHDFDLSGIEEAHAETWDKLEKVKIAMGGSKATMEAMVRAMSDTDVTKIFDIMEEEFSADKSNESKDGKLKYDVSFQIVDLADEEPYADLQDEVILDCGTVTNIKYDPNSTYYSANLESSVADISKLEDLFMDELSDKIDTMLGLSVENVDIELKNN